jgi:hypothetical protein
VGASALVGGAKATESRRYASLPGHITEAE